MTSASHRKEEKTLIMSAWDALFQNMSKLYRQKCWNDHFEERGRKKKKDWIFAVSVHKIPLAEERKLILVGTLLTNHSAKDLLYHLAFFLYSCTEHKEERLAWHSHLHFYIHIWYYVQNINFKRSGCSRILVTSSWRWSQT